MSGFQGAPSQSRREYAAVCSHEYCQVRFSWPGYLDNTVAGGIPSGMSIFDSLVKECMEEASLEPDVVRKYTRAVGSISYFIRCVLSHFFLSH